jgi:hypothetical protein
VPPLTNGTAVFIVGEASLAATIAYSATRAKKRHLRWVALVGGALIAVATAVGFVWWVVSWLDSHT